MSICLILAEKTIENVRSVINQYSNKADKFELRADYLLKSEFENINDVRNFTSKKIIFTIRKSKDGGIWDGSEEDRKRIYIQAMEAKFDFIDIEIGSFPGLKGNKNTKIIRSHHDFSGVPNDIDSIYEQASLDLNEIPKIAVKIDNCHDFIRFMQWMERLRKKELCEKIIIGMGKRGIFTRILRKQIGSMHTYVSTPKTFINSNFIDINDAFKLYKMHLINKDTQIHAKLYESYEFNCKHIADDLIVSENSVYVPFIIDSEEELNLIKKYFNITNIYTRKNFESSLK